MEISNAKALVTGGSSGIGLEIARQLRAKGASVAICGRRAEPLEAAAAEIGATAIVGDVSKSEDAERMVATTISECGGYNVLINNAAWGYFAPLVEIERETFESMMATNVTGAMLVAQASARHFIEQSTGNIVNVASTAARSGFARGTAYAASKFALTAMTECWRAELRPHNVRVMQVNPSEVQTQFAANAGYEQQRSERKLHSEDIAHMVVAALEMHDRGFTTDFTIFATNPNG